MTIAQGKLLSFFTETFVDNTDRAAGDVQGYVRMTANFELGRFFPSFAKDAAAQVVYRGKQAALT